MKRESRAWLALGVAWIVALQQAGCAAPVGGTPDVVGETAALTVTEDGEALFREILFPNAESAKRSPALARLYEYSGLSKQSPEQQKAIEAVQALLLSGVRDLDPEFFTRFAKGVSSRDVRQADGALQEASVLLRESLRGWNEVLDEALSDEGLEKLHERLSKDDRSQALRDLANLDRAAVQKLAEMLREQLVPVPDGTPVRMPTIAVARQVDLTVALDRQIARQTFLPPNLNIQRPPQLDLDINRQLVLPSRAIDLNLDRQLQLPVRAIDLNLNRQLQLPAKAIDLAQQADLAYVGDVTVDVETAVYAVIAVAVAVVAVVVAVFGRPIDESAAYLNGKNTELFRDQMIAEITVGYAR